MKELIYQTGTIILKIRITDDKKILAASQRTGWVFYPSADALVNEDAEFLEENDIPYIVDEMNREMAKKGFKLVQEYEVNG